MSRSTRPTREARGRRNFGARARTRRRSVPALAIAALLAPMLGGASVMSLGEVSETAEDAVTAASVTVVPEQPPALDEPPLEPGKPPAASPEIATPVIGAPASVPTLLWRAYAAAVAGAPAECHLSITLLAAIGQVESGSLSGRALDPGHRVVPSVLGPVLDGNGFAAIADTDGGALDGDTRWDRAVGPMQFIPSTWAGWGRDGDGDGTANPQDIEDAAAAAAAYLCADGRDLATPDGLRAAILSYNHSMAYLALVLHWKRAFEAVPPETWPIETVSAASEPTAAAETARAEAADVPPVVVRQPPAPTAATGPTPAPTGPSAEPSAPAPSQPTGSGGPSTEPTNTPSGPAASPPGETPAASPTTSPTPDPKPKPTCPPPSPEPTTDPTTDPTGQPPVEPTTEPTTEPTAGPPGSPDPAGTPTPPVPPDPCAVPDKTPPAPTP